MSSAGQGASDPLGPAGARIGVGDAGADGEVRECAAGDPPGEDESTEATAAVGEVVRRADLASGVADGSGARASASGTELTGGRLAGGTLRAFMQRQRDDLIRDALLGGLLAGVAFGGAVWWDSRLADRQEVLENTRFVRQIAISSDTTKPFDGINLRGAELGGLGLGCVDLAAKKGCAILVRARLADAILARTDLSGAVLTYAELTDANLAGTNLSGAELQDADLTRALIFETNLSGADLSRANLSGVQFAGADLTGADLAGANFSGSFFGGVDLRSATLLRANFSGAEIDSATFPPTLGPVCFDGATRWPEGFSAPAHATCSADQVHAQWIQRFAAAAERSSFVVGILLALGAWASLRGQLSLARIFGILMVSDVLLATSLLGYVSSSTLSRIIAGGTIAVILLSFIALVQMVRAERRSTHLPEPDDPAKSRVP